MPFDNAFYKKRDTSLISYTICMLLVSWKSIIVPPGFAVDKPLQIDTGVMIVPIFSHSANCK